MAQFKKLGIAGGGGTGLPSVTVDDVGEVLTVNDEGEWESQPLPIYNGESEGGTSGGSGGVPQYNLSTVLKAREEVTLDITDTMALFSIVSDMNNLLKFQNIGVVIEAEEAEGHQPFIGLDIKPDYVDNALLFSYQGVFYNIDLIVDPVAQVIKGRLNSKSQVGGSDVLTVEISQTGASGYLDVDLVGLITEKFPNVNIRQLGKTIYTALEFDATTNQYKFANVNTSDTQAETKLITVNANTNQWTATQYLADLGGGSGGSSRQKVTLAELQTMLTAENVGTQIFIQAKHALANIVGQDLYEALVFVGLGNFITVIAMSDIPFIACTNTVYAQGALNSFSILLTPTIGNTATIQQYDFATDTATTPSSLTAVFTDEYFDFYIYR